MITAEEALTEQADQAKYVDELKSFRDNVLKPAFENASAEFASYIVSIIDEVNIDIYNQETWLKDLTEFYTNPFGVSKTVEAK